MKIVYLSAIAYDDLKQRPQYMAEKLSEKNEVIYVMDYLYYLFGGNRMTL